MKRKNLVTAAILCLSVTMLTACGGTEESKKTTTGKSAEVKSGITVVDKDTTEEGTTTDDTTTESATVVDDNETTGEETTTKQQETTTVKEEIDFDFSKYEQHGRFSEGLAWVCESDYTGTQYGYINTKGEVVIPFSECITKCYDCKNGIVVVVYKDAHWSNNVAIVFYDTDGNEIDRITANDASFPTVKYFNNGNMFIRYAGERYMYINNSLRGYVRRAEAGLGEKCGDYSEGLLYSGDCFRTSAARGCYVIFFDEYGDVAIDLSRETGEYYKGVCSATDFKNGKSQIIFNGLDGKRYTVEIDTKGNWLGEPQQVDEDFRVRSEK